MSNLVVSTISIDKGTRSAQFQFPYHQQKMESMFFSRDGKFVAAVLEDRQTIQVFGIDAIKNPNSSQEIKLLGEIKTSAWAPEIVFIPNSTALAILDFRETAEIWDYESNTLVWKDPEDECISFNGMLYVDPKGTMLWIIGEDCWCLDLATLTYSYLVYNKINVKTVQMVNDSILVICDGEFLHTVDLLHPPKDYTIRSPGEKIAIKKMNELTLFDCLNHLTYGYNGNIEETVDWITINDEYNFMTRMPNNNIITFIHGGDLVVMNIVNVTQKHIDSIPKQNLSGLVETKKECLSMEYIPSLRRFIIIARDYPDEKKLYKLVFKVPLVTKRNPVKLLIFESMNDLSIDCAKPHMNTSSTDRVEHIEAFGSEHTDKCLRTVGTEDNTTDTTKANLLLLPSGQLVVCASSQITPVPLYY